MEYGVENINREEAAQIYLKRRLEILNTDRQKLENRINTIKYEADEIDKKIHEINNGFDSTYEIFSPKPKDKGFDKKEVGSLQLKKNELLISLKDFSKEYDLILRDISDINNILTDNEGESDDVTSGIPADTLEDMQACMPCIQEYPSEYISGYDILEQREDERKKLSLELQQNAIMQLDNLMHKCEMCSKIIEHDITRAKSELKIMSGMIKDTIDDMGTLVNYLNPVEMAMKMGMEIEQIGFDDAIKILLNKLQTDVNMAIEFEENGDKINMPSIMEKIVLRTIVDGVKGIAGFLNSDIFTEDVAENFENKIYLLLKYEQCDFNGIYIVMENKNEGYSDDENIEEMDISYDVKNDFGLFMIEENVYLLGGDVTMEAYENKKIKIEITIPIPTME